MAESSPSDEQAIYYEKDEAKQNDMSQEGQNTEESELSKLMIRLERAGVSYDFQNAVQNNEASDEVIAELNALMDDLDAMSKDSEEWEKQLKLINEYEIAGLHHAKLEIKSKIGKGTEVSVSFINNGLR